MGSANQKTASPMHNVKIIRPFLMSSFPCTQDLYEKVMGSNPSTFIGSNSPVDSVSWLDAVVFCNKLSALRGLDLVYQLPNTIEQSEECAKQITCDWTANGFRLPTEAEWEYAACSSGTQKLFSQEDTAWHNKDTSQAVGLLQPNDVGLYDMLGNIWEWVWDTPFRLYTTETEKDPKYIDHLVASHIIRGGCFDSTSSECTTYYREWFFAHRKLDRIGFRIVRNQK